jgi:hypothetical protein
MFVQVIHGRARDPEAVHRQLEVWERDVKPGAIGYLGSTGGCTADGSCILVARFEDRDAAMRNSERPEQSAWWRETEALFDGPVEFHDTEDVHLMAHGDLDGAHFVQVMEGHVADRSRLDAMESDSDDMLAELRPDLLGSVTAFYDDDSFTELAYFTSESDARRGESAPMPPDAEPVVKEWQRVMPVDHYMDLADPWLITA